MLHPVVLAELRQYCAADTVQNWRAEETLDGCILRFDLNWRPNNALYTHTRKSVRAWKDVQRFIEFIKGEPEIVQRVARDGILLSITEPASDIAPEPKANVSNP